MLDKISYIIHFRKDSDKRIENLIAIREFYRKLAPDIQFIIIEDDVESRFDSDSHLYENDIYKFVKNDSIYIRPHCFNMGASISQRDIVVAGDTDVFIHPDYLNKAATHLLNDDVSFIYPYNGMFVVVEAELRKQFINTIDYTIVDDRVKKLSKRPGVTVDGVTTGHPQSKGGCVMFNKKHFKEFGGYNPNFKGWGYEDDEIFTRATRLGYTPGRIMKEGAVAWHLEHSDPNGDKKNLSNPHYEENNTIARGSRLMPLDELRVAVDTWKTRYSWNDYIKAVELLTPNRFDITAKLLFGDFYINNYSSSWGREVYKEHLRVWNNFKEYNPRRDSYEDFESNFINILQSINKKGFDPSYPIPITNTGRAVNGAHRIASSILYDKKIYTRKTNTPDQDGQLNCDWQYFNTKSDFVNGGLQEKYLDSMAYTYCKYKKNTFVVSIFPSAVGDLNKVESLIREHAEIVYKKQFKLNQKGALAFVRNTYHGEDWGGNWHNKFEGFFTKARLCFKNDAPVITYLVESDLNSLLPLKQKIRDIYQIDKSSVHINDTHDETVRIAQFAFNNNSIHFANNSTPTLYPTFQKILNDYVSAEKSADDFCVTGSAVMAMYGLRSAKDVDYFHKYKKLVTNNNLISSHNNEIHHYTTTIDNVLYSPENHFWFCGTKFAALHVIRALKEKRNEIPKDVDDVKLMITI